MSSRRQRTVATAILAVALIGAGGAVATGARSSDDGSGRPSAHSSSPAPATPSTTEAPPVERSAPVRVQIRRMRLNAPVVRLEAGDDQVMQLPPLRRPGWDSTSVTPGEKGVAVLAGHIGRGTDPGALQDLGRLRRGDVIVVRREDSSVARFEVDRIVGYELGTFPAEQVYASSGVPELRLISIGGSLEGQPPGNVVVYATAVPEPSAG